jgi:Transcriptional regulator
MKETRDHILTVSSSLFLQKSFLEVSMKDIVNATGLSKGAFYHYFKSKEQLFLEVVESIFAGIIDMNCSDLPRDSLHSFYRAYLGRLEERYRALVMSGLITPSFSLSYYSLLFDAMRYFPDFKARLNAMNAEERKAWLRAVAAARAQEELASPMGDEQIVDIFIHTNSGVGMSNIMVGSSGNTIAELGSLWDGFYSSLRRDRAPQ